MRRAGGALLLVLVVPLAGCGGDGDPEAGALARARDAATGTTTEVVLPNGTLNVVVGDPVASVEEDDSKDLEEQPEVDDAGWLPVSWTFDPFAGPWGGALSSDPQAAEVAVRVDGSSYAVGPPYRVVGPGTGDAPDDSFYVLVPGEPEPEDVGIEVTYAGHPVAGLEALGDAPPPGVPCQVGGTPASAELDCEISSVGTTPYYPGAGWAQDGEVWTVVQVRAVRLLSASSRSVVAIEDRSTVGGVPPLAGLTQQRRPQEYVAAGTLVVPTPAGALGSAGPLQLDLGFTLDDGSQVEATATVPLR